MNSSATVGKVQASSLEDFDGRDDRAGASEINQFQQNASAIGSHDIVQRLGFGFEPTTGRREDIVVRKRSSAVDFNVEASRVGGIEQAFDEMQSQRVCSVGQRQLQGHLVVYAPIGEVVTAVVRLRDRIRNARTVDDCRRQFVVGCTVEANRQILAACFPAAVSHGTRVNQQLRLGRYEARGIDPNWNNLSLLEFFQTIGRDKLER